jgi:competence protein ComEA
MLRNFKSYLAGFLAGLLSTGLLLIFISGPRGQPIQLQPPPTSGPILVYVSGAVAHPGVYEMPADAVIQHAIETAGGPIEGAVLDIINLAAQLKSGQQIYVPHENDQSDTTSVIIPDAILATGELININAATAPELESLPGIGPSIALKIVEFRESNGPFLEIDDLLQVSGIGPAKLEQIRDLISVR